MIFAAESLGAVGTGKVANACVHYEVSFHVFLRKKATCWLVGNGKRREESSISGGGSWCLLGAND